MMKFLSTICAVALLAGCAYLPLNPGSASIQSDSGKVISVKQPQNPKDSTIQDYKKTTAPDGTVTEEVHTKIGAAQKDTAREMVAKLGSMKGIMWLGVLVFLFGAVSFFHPGLKLIVSSTTTSMVITAAGLLLTVLPTLVVGNELLMLGVTLGGTALYVFAHRYGKLRGFVDANKDGIDDRTQN